jgi:hypothetical protein
MDGRSGRARNTAQGLARACVVPERGGERSQDRGTRSVPPPSVRGRGPTTDERVDAGRDPAGWSVVARRGYGGILRYLAIARDGALRLADVRAQWLRSAKSTSATLRALATLRGQRETPSPYDIYALAVELLVRDRDPTLVFTYYEGVARGTAWPDAFAATFGRTYEAFVDEFEAFRRTA